MTGGADLLSYALLTFLAYIYLPTALFRLCAELHIDLGRKADATQFEEIISAFIPGFLLNVVPFVAFIGIVELFPVEWPFDWAVVASIFGRDRGAVSDYIYGGKLAAAFWYIALLWGLSSLWGFCFGKRTAKLCKENNNGLDGIEKICEGKLTWSMWFLWLPWYWILHESFVPLYTWKARTPYVRIETTTQQLYWGRLAAYEKTTAGQIDAIHLNGVKRRLAPDSGCTVISRRQLAEWTETDHVYLKWSRVAEIHVIEKSDYDEIGSNAPSAADAVVGGGIAGLEKLTLTGPAVAGAAQP